MDCHVSFSSSCAFSRRSWTYGVVLLLQLALGVHAQVTNLISFNSGTTPMGGLVQATDGNLYGTTLLAGSNNVGTVFRVDTNGNFFPVHSFTGGADGAYPYGNLIQGLDGGLYGTTWAGGQGYGTVFRIGLDGTFTHLHLFNGADGYSPYGGLVQVPGGTLFGTTVLGGAYGYGEVFQISTNANGGFAPVYAFTGASDGAFPFCQLLLANDGYLYGTTAEANVTNGGYGTIFVMNPANGAFENYYAFTGFSGDGAYPYGGLAQGNDGYLYGTTAGLPPNSALPVNTVGGTVFKVPPFGTTFAFDLLHYFLGEADGEYPYAALVKASDGNLYGTTTGLTNNAAQEGTLFAITGGSTFSTLLSFNGGNGANPYDSLVQGLDGNLYGTTSTAGVNGGGTVFRFYLAAPPFILRQPASQTAFSLTTVSFTVLAGGTAPLSYRWLQGTTNLSDGGNISGSFSNTLTISGVCSSNAGSYSVLVTSQYGQVTSAAAQLVVKAIKPTLTILTPAQNASVYDATYTVTGKASEALGIASVSYSLNTGPWTPAATTNNWTNWNAVVSFVPGTNTLRAYAIDPYGNTSSTNAVRFFYLLTAPIVVQTNGFGTVKPNYNGESLVLGRIYTMTAKAGQGFVFTNWTGSWTTNSPTLKFLMASNLEFTANFVDDTPPKVTITAPTANQHVSNAMFTVTGKASDNVSVASVDYQLNGLGWNPATPVNGWSNWTEGVTLTPGTNLVQAYATDNAGNRSLTNTIKFIYVLTAPIVVQTNGFGTITPDYNGDLLAIGQSYTMTAKAGKGFAFTNWTGSLTTNSAKLTFLMASNLNFTANFVDDTPPKVTIAAPTANQHVSNAMFAVTGKASDNVSVASVYYQLNGLGWNPATPVNGWSNWTEGVTLTPGTNLVQAYATDNAGNRSLTNTIKFIYVLTAPIVVQTNGFGTITPDYNGICWPSDRVTR